MATTKFEAEKFNGKNDFGLWRIKMKALLIQQGLADFLTEKQDQKDDKGKIEASEAAKKPDLDARAHSTIILCLSDKVLREVSKETTAAGVWAKLESLYMEKSLANRLYSKQRLYSYKLVEDKNIIEQLDEFNRAIDDLENIEVKLGDEDKAIILLNALPKSYEHLKDAMLYGREKSITLDEVQSAIKAKELQKVIGLKKESPAEILNVRGKFKKAGKFKKPYSGNKKYQQNKAKEDDDKDAKKCFHCKKPGHIRRDCYSWKRLQAKMPQETDSADVIEQCQTAEVLNIVNHDIGEQWIMDSACTLCHIKEWFTDIHYGDLGSVMMGNNKTCGVKGIGSIRLRTQDGKIKIIQEVRYIPKRI